VKVILTKDVAKLGKSGEMRMVADGYATNFLIPQQLAVPAAGGAYRAWQHDIASREDKRVRERGEAEIAATRIASTTLTMGVKVGEGGKLYGSITSKDIGDALARRGIEVDRHKIDLEEPLKTLGTYKVAIKVYAGMTAEVTVVVDPRADPPAPADLVIRALAARRSAAVEWTLDLTRRR
jgi:large subunit ribosomal protein L9